MCVSWNTHIDVSMMYCFIYMYGVYGAAAGGYPVKMIDAVENVIYNGFRIRYDDGVG